MLPHSPQTQLRSWQELGSFPVGLRMQQFHFTGNRICSYRSRQMLTQPKGLNPVCRSALELSAFVTFVHLSRWKGFFPSSYKNYSMAQNFYEGKGKHGNQAQSIMYCKARLTRKCCQQQQNWPPLQFWCSLAWQKSRKNRKQVQYVGATVQLLVCIT